MSQTTTREERRDALEEFAKTTPVSSDMLPVPGGHAALPAIVGSQLIAGERRDNRRVRAELKELAAMAGSDWFYRFPVKNKKTGTTEWIEGPSIELAMAVLGVVGNIEVDTRVQDYGSSFMIYARAVDLEKGSAVTRAFQQSKSAARIGGADDSRRNDMALQIGQSKAIRNVICALLKTHADFAFDEAQKSIVETIGDDLERWRSRLVEKLSAKVDLKRVEAVVGRAAKDWLAPDVARVIAMAKAVEDGMASMDDTFPELANKVPPEASQDKLDSFAEQAPELNEIDAVNSSSGGDAKATAAGPGEATAAVAQRAIDTMLDLANNSQLTPEERLEQLDGSQLRYEDQGLPQDFVATMLKTCADVARGKLPKADARRYLMRLIK